MEMIFLNGPSSSGKSSIARELQSLLNAPYLHLGIDNFIAMMPEKSNRLNTPNQPADGFYWHSKMRGQHTVQRIAFGDYGKAVNDAYRTTVRHLLDAGLNVIVDDAINGAEEMAVWQSVLAGKQCLFVGVFCTDEILVQREKQRGDRLPGSALEQASRVHQGIRYDIQINTASNSPRACAHQILRDMTRGNSA
ncbi:chloramphenicol phosphotransferase CPT family protein [Photobacterium sp. 1_MG-2023]|uniref:chloramphenicol phosphotransferase CPT family protein n=1 Tax=Photobacterium sp. 1_MG-2023 TaxID=3062646 RepID=UPI0026E32832|nr:AAA family ATPase [Photobacterium sp. 1_MG-2023]MDO6708934.1 AAA family ATPase [Photobacterium sp. 1_MG-2023]